METFGRRFCWVAVWTIFAASWTLPATAQPNPDYLWTNSAITNWITVVNKNTGALVRELYRAGTDGGNGLGIAVVGNTVFYTVKTKNVLMLDKNSGAELGIAFSIPQATQLSAITFDGRNFWIRDYDRSEEPTLPPTQKAYYVTPAGVVLKTITLANCGFQCDALEYVDGKLIADRLFETTPNYYDVYDTSGNLVQAAFITTGHPGRSIAYDGTSYYISEATHIYVYNSSGVYVRSMAPGGTYVNYRDLSFESAAPLPATSVTRGDFDGDGKTDIAAYQSGSGATYQPGAGDWHVLNSGTGYTTDTTFRWGVSGDVPTPGDYDGDGRGDVAIFRPGNGRWWVLKSGSNYTASASYAWGVSTDVPVPADYDGDGKTDIAVYRPSTGVWWVLQSSSNFTTSTSRQWGASGDVPAPRDYDGDSKADFAVFRPSSGTWFALQSSSGFSTYSVRQWGSAGDTPVAADYDGDGKTDYAVYRPTTGVWWTLLSTTNFSNYVAREWGGRAGDMPVQADYDGDSRTDVAVYRSATGVWHIVQSSNGVTVAR